MKKHMIMILMPALLLTGCIETTDQKPQKQDSGVATDKKAFVKVEEKGNVDFNGYFKNRTMRVDYFHTGNAKDEVFAIDRVVADGPWPGSRKVLVDPLKLGPYLFQVVDERTGMLMYSRGFASIFGEWQTIPEAKERWGTFHESVRFPWPNIPVTLIISKRDSANKFRQLWTTVIDPSSRQVNPAGIEHKEKIFTIHESGAANEKVDIVILGDGYTSAEMAKFRGDAKRLTEILLGVEPFKSRSGDLNIRCVETPSAVSGVSKPHPGIYKRTPLSAHYSSFDSERYILSYDNRKLRDVASAVPYEFMVILVNEKTYGGGGIYNLYTTVSADNKFTNYIMVHELGHHIAALADEYYTSSVSYEVPEIEVEPWETNITALFDPDNLKWEKLVEEGTPIPTPWNKEEFDAFGYEIQKERDSLRAAKVPESQVEALFIRQLKKEDEFFSNEKYRDVVGAFEGAGYMQKGLYRSQLDCMMYTRHMEFCKVCQRSISRVIDTYNR